MNIRQAQSGEDYDQACALFREYAAWLDVDLCFQDFDAELQMLDRIYASPYGCILLVFDTEYAAGCVGVRALPGVGEDACEMKRLYVRPSWQGRGIGRQLAHAVLNEGRRLGYARMFLDTLEWMEQTRSLYRSLGFTTTEAYYHNPLDGVRYMQARL